MKDDKGFKYLEIIRYEAIDNWIHTTIQATESHSQVIHNHMMRHVWVEIHHHLQHQNDTHNHFVLSKTLLATTYYDQGRESGLTIRRTQRRR